MNNSDEFIPLFSVGLLNENPCCLVHPEEDITYDTKQVACMLVALVDAVVDLQSDGDQLTTEQEILDIFQKAVSERHEHVHKIKYTVEEDEDDQA